MQRRKLVAGNWKMHGTAADLDEVRAIAGAAAQFGGQVDVALCLPGTLIHRAADAVPGFPIGAQDVHASEKGAFTGDTSVAMLRDAGAVLTIVGHSERRDLHREDDSGVKAKAEAALAAGLDVILCVGESLEEREAGRAVATVAGQLGGSLPERIDPAHLALAYEPIWAIGTGKVASCDDIAEIHAAIRALLVERFGAAGEGVRILYGGSVKASNAGEIFAVADVDGALVGGASLKAADFLPIVEAAARPVESRAA
ncbi:triose-phosphate isomerase [Sphingomonas ginkgonis]|uniref:Triosephosphate isomerase n=1 Tax=Sphingomonas ginkgonis TaxID=2315330 RepID=A0A3R9YMA1_9SPHN|nr:triose-phosphate isomerase [Sphingomonas ginkgonis]RST30702.1 triose-phosphate isomerase [Sphingomonas ginkgonis]